MSQATTAACKLNDRHHFYEKNSISQGEKKVSCFSGFNTLVQWYGVEIQSQYRLPRLLNLGSLIIQTLRNLPTLLFVGLDHNSFKRLWYFVYFDVLAQDLIRVSRNGAGLLLWEEGPVTANASIPMWFASRNQGVWENELARKAVKLVRVMDGLIWLDAPDSVLIERVRAHPLNRWLQACSLDEIREFYIQYRKIYESVMTTYIHNQVPVLKISTDECSAVETARMAYSFIASLNNTRKEDKYSVEKKCIGK